MLRENLSPDPFASLDGPVMVFVNGFFRRDLSRLRGLPKGVSIEPLGELLEKAPSWLAARLGQTVPITGEPVQGLNLALMRDGAVIRVPPGVGVEKPLRLLHITPEGETGKATHTRTLVIMEPGAEGTLLESHIGPDGDPRLATLGTEIILSEESRLDHVKVHTGGAGALHAAGIYAKLAARSDYRSFFLTTGGRLTRNDVHVTLSGEEAHAQVSGASLVAGGIAKGNDELVKAMTDSFDSIVADGTYMALIEKYNMQGSEL